MQPQYGFLWFLHFSPEPPVGGWVEAAEGYL
jgi:hypothetical protein